MSLRGTSVSPTPTLPTQAAPFSRMIVAQTRAELRMTLRRGESVLVTLIIPVLLLFFAMTLNIVPGGPSKAITFLLPGMLGAAVMSAGMVSLGIATAYERYYGVLKRLGASPLPRWGLLAAKIAAVLVVEAAQVAILVFLAAALYGWKPAGAPLLAALLLLLGTATFAGLGLLMAGALRAEATLAGANGLYLVFLLVGGVILPTDHLPGPFAALASVLPAAAFTDSLRGALSPQGAPLGSVLLLVGWLIVILIAAARLFKWE